MNNFSIMKVAVHVIAEQKSFEQFIGRAIAVEVQGAGGTVTTVHFEHENATTLITVIYNSNKLLTSTIASAVELSLEPGERIISVTDNISKLEP